MKTLTGISKSLFQLGLTISVSIYILSFLEGLFAFLLVYTLPPTFLFGAIWSMLWVNQKSKSVTNTLLSNMLFVMLIIWITLTLIWFVIFFIEEGNYYEVIEEAFAPAVGFSLVYWFACLIVYQITEMIVSKRIEM